MKVHALVGVAVLAALVLAQPAGATVVEFQSLDEMAAKTPLLVRGKVGAEQSRWDDAHRRIQTFTEVLVTETLKGDGHKVLLVRQPGGEVGPVGQSVSGAARFTTGEDVVLFLEPARDDAGVYVVRALSAGKIAIGKDTLGRVRATRDLRGVAFYDAKAAAAVREVNAVEDLGDAEALLSRLRRAVKAGGAK